MTDANNTEQTPFDKLEYSTEISFNSLINSTIKNGLLPAESRPAGIMYMPTQQVTQQFKDACAAVIKDLGVEVKNSNET